MIGITKPTYLYSRVSHGEASSRLDPPPGSEEAQREHGRNSGEMDMGTEDERYELRCVVAVIRHGDRTPKQKMKMKVSWEPFLAFFSTYSAGPRKDLKVKARAHLKEFMEVTKTILRSLGVTVAADADSMASTPLNSPRIGAIPPRDVSPSGMGGSVQHLTLESAMVVGDQGFCEGGMGGMPPGVSPTEHINKLLQILDVLRQRKISGINRKVQLKPLKWADMPSPDNGYASPKGELSLPKRKSQTECAVQLQLVLKWGGDLTELGEDQARRLGENFRNTLYQGISNSDGLGPVKEDGIGILGLHSSCQHDLKIRSSDEGRVMKTAGAFTKGMLELEGELTPILVSLVQTERTDGAHQPKATSSSSASLVGPGEEKVNDDENGGFMLDHIGNKAVKERMEATKEALHNMLGVDKVLIGRDNGISQLIPEGAESVMAALTALGNPRKALQRIHELIGDLVTQLETLQIQQNLLQGATASSVGSVQSDQLSPAVGGGWQTPSGGGGGGGRGTREHGGSDNGYGRDHALPPSLVREDGQLPVGHGETLLLMLERWKKLKADLYNPKYDTFQLSKVPDVHDNVRYEALNNRGLPLNWVNMKALHSLAKTFADVIVPLEYGMSKRDKVSIGARTCRQLLTKLRNHFLEACSDIETCDIHHKVNLAHAPALSRPCCGTMVRTRLYFTSESHLHTLINVLRHSPTPGKEPFLPPFAIHLLENTPELCFLTHVVFRVFKDKRNNSFRLEVLFSPGANGNPFETIPENESPVKAPPFGPGATGSGRRLGTPQGHEGIAPLVPLVVEKTPFDLEEFLRTAMKAEGLEMYEN
ncbi:unnamed protein product [Discosporangium mesarthrocarpum]